METNNSSHINGDNIKQDANENADERKNKTEKKENMQPGHKNNKGTGMSSEAGASQSEKEWQDTSGSTANSGN